MVFSAGRKIVLTACALALAGAPVRAAQVPSAALRVPFTVQEPADIDRDGSPVYVAIPLPSDAPNSTDALLARWYADGLIGLAQGLPIYYVSAGIAGAAVGISLSRNMEHARQQAAEPAGAEV